MLIVFVLVFLFGSGSGGVDAATYNLVSLMNTTVGLEGHLQLVDPDKDPNSFAVLTLTVLMESADRFRVHITPPATDPPRWRVPETVLSPLYKSPPSKAAVETNYDFIFTYTPFTMKAVRRGSSAVSVFHFTGNMVFEDRFMMFETSLDDPSSDGPFVYGLGERIESLRLPTDGEIYTIWNKDHGNPSRVNLYGTHPFYLQMRRETSPLSYTSCGVFLFNSNGMDILTEQNTLTYKIMGGVLDFIVFMGPSPTQVVQQYTEVIGNPFLPPMFSLGFHQSRWGYATAAETKTVVQTYESLGLPLDAIWNDIDYMQAYHDFTIDPDRYGKDEMQAFHQWLEDRGQQHIFIIDPAIPAIQNYTPYSEGLAQGVFVGEPQRTQQPLLNKVWPNEPVAFPDFTNTDSTFPWWENQIFEFFKQVGSTLGLWMDMNEPASFCEGQYPNQCRTVTGPPYSLPKKTYVEDTRVQSAPVYTPHQILTGPLDFIPEGAHPLADSTLNMSAQQTWSIHYDVHNLYGFTELAATVHALHHINGKRAFVLTRSTFAGSGRLGAHWSGDNEATFQSLASSIPSMLSMSMFGLAMTGSDICGFSKNTTEELCTRWMQVGAFYPFSRNHNSWDTISQEPFAFGTHSTVYTTSKRYLSLRYQLLQYYYSLFYRAHLYGETVARPLFFEFSEDVATWTIDQQFMVGPALLVNPVLSQGATTVNAYIPGGCTWYDIETAEVLVIPSREFTLAEIEHFVDPEDKSHVRFHQVADLVLPLLPASLQDGDHEAVPTKIGEAVAKGTVDNETLGYFMARTYLFVESIGVDLKRVRFRQHKSTEMAHYASDCWDLEIFTFYGWVECVGHADRACYDLRVHQDATNTSLCAEVKYDEPKMVEEPDLVINKQVIGKKYKREAKPLIQYLGELETKEAMELKAAIEKDGSSHIKLCTGQEYDVDTDSVQIGTKMVKKFIRKYQPSVVEPSFGLGRILYCVLEHAFDDTTHADDEARAILRLKPWIAPFKVGVLSLSMNHDFVPMCEELRQTFVSAGLATRTDLSGASIGKKYTRQDMLGTPFSCVVDFQSLNDNTFSLRDRDTCKQIRLEIGHAASVVSELSSGRMTFQQALDKFGEFVKQDV